MIDVATWSLPVEAVSFLRDLQRHNDRDWFNENKAVYERAIKAPAETMRAAIGDRLLQLTGFSHRSKVFRLNRDLRFSKDKTPYSPYLRLEFAPETDVPSPPGWYVSLEPDRFVLGTGLFAFDKQGLDAYRARIGGAEGDDLAHLLEQLQAKGARTSDPDLKRVPPGYPNDHPHALQLRRKGLTAWVDHLDPMVAARQPTVPTAVDAFRRLKPLFDWLMDTPR